MRAINFYITDDGRCPVADSWIRYRANRHKRWPGCFEELDVVPVQYLEKLVNTDDIWEVRVQVAGNIFRLLGFFEGNDLIVLNHAFQKKTQKTPVNDIRLAEQRRKHYLHRRKHE